MLQLPSGHIVGIMHERARYHAMRQHLRITPYLPTTRLYPLIDVVFAGGAGAPGLWQKGPVFSGHTLADHDWLMQWPEQDREAFLAWVNERAQQREIEAARRRVLADDKPLQQIHYPYPARLYSLLARRIETLGLDRAPVGQWRNTLRNMQGLRREEMEWSGVMKFLDAVEASGRDSVSRGELLQQIDFADIRMELVNELECDHEASLHFVEKAKLYTNAQLHCAGIWVAANELGIVRYINPSLGYRIGRVRPRLQHPRAPMPARWFALTPYMEALPDPRDGACVFYTSAKEAMAAATAHARLGKRLLPRLRLRDRYAYMSLAGGEDYREWLLTLPDYPLSHFTAHYLERNVLLHIRTKLRTDRAGHRLLFIEEIQSDWHQAAAKHGYKNWASPIPAAPFHREWVTLAMKLMLLHAAEQGYDGLAWTDGATQQLRYGLSLTPVRRIYDTAIPASLNRLGRPWSAAVGLTQIPTQRPNLMAARHQEQWGVRDHDGRLHTRPRHNHREVMALIRRHSKAIDLPVPVFLLTTEMRAHLLEHGAPLFGELYT